MGQVKNKAKKRRVACPDCGKVRWISLWHIIRPTYTGRCVACSNAARTISRTWVKRGKESRSKVQRELPAPCGSMIVPCITAEHHSTVNDPVRMSWKGRCGGLPMLECDWYEDCLAMVANEGWNGWKRKPVTVE